MSQPCCCSALLPALMEGEPGALPPSDGSLERIYHTVSPRSSTPVCPSPPTYMLLCGPGRQVTGVRPPLYRCAPPPPTHLYAAVWSWSSALSLAPLQAWKKAARTCRGEGVTERLKEDWRGAHDPHLVPFPCSPRLPPPGGHVGEGCHAGRHPCHMGRPIAHMGRNHYTLTSPPPPMREVSMRACALSQPAPPHTRPRSHGALLRALSSRTVSMQRSSHLPATWSPPPSAPHLRLLRLTEPVVESLVDDVGAFGGDQEAMDAAQAHRGLRGRCNRAPAIDIQNSRVEGRKAVRSESMYRSGSAQNSNGGTGLRQCDKTKGI